MADVFAHPWLGGLFGDPQIARIWSAERQLEHMCAFEAAWSRAGHRAGLWSAEAGEAAAKAIEAAQIRPEELADGAGRDGVCVPALVARLRELAGSQAVHTGATSQDVIDTATVLSALETIGVLQARLESLETALRGLEAAFGERPLMGRTRMRAAVETTAGARIRNWIAPVRECAAQLDGLRGRIGFVQTGGAVGDDAALGQAAPEIRADVAKALGLSASAESWHVRRGRIAEFGSALSMLTGALGKMGQDVCLMSQDELDEIALGAVGGSSVMPHKRNPVLAELLVALARFNAVQVSGLHHSLVHEQERSGAAWSLEWMILPQMAMAAGRSAAAAVSLAESVNRVGRA